MATTRKNTNKSETIAERFARIKQGVQNLDDETEDTQQQISFREYLRAKEQGINPQTSKIQQAVNPDMTAESMADYARYNNTKGAQLTNYDLLSDDLKNRLTEMTDLEDSDSSGLIRKTDDGSGLFGYKLEPGWKVNDIKDELRNDFHLDDETIKDLAEVNRSAKNRDEINAIRGDNTFEDQLQQYAEDNYVRTYPEEIEYATSKFSDATDDVDSLRRDINSYNSTASQKAEDYFTRPTLIQSIKSLASGENSNDLKQQIMEKYNLTDEQFEDLAYYGKELDNYDARAEQQEQAEKNVSHDNTKDNVIGGTINSLASQVTYLPGALSGVAETGKYYAGRLTGTSYDKHSPIDPNSAGFAATNASDDLQNATQQSISNWNHAAGLVYGAAMSTAKSAQTSMFAPGGASIGANIASKYGLSNAGTKLAIKVGSEVAGLAPFGAAAFSSALSDNVTSGKSMSDSLSDAARSASIEVITEIASLDKVYDIAKGNSRLARKIIADFAASTLIEGLEEMTGDALELITDNLKYGGDSDFNQSVKNYMGKGYTEEEATSLAWDDWKAQLIEDGIAGALSGAMGGAGATAIGVHSATQSANEWFGNYTKDSYKQFAEGVNTDANTYVSKSAADSAKKARDLANKYATQDTVSDKERRELYYTYNDAIDTENEARIEAAEKAEDQARKAVQQHKEWRAHESAVDEYNKSRGVETSEDTTEQSIAEAIPQELRAKENDSTAGDVHKEMAQSKTLDALDNAIQRGLSSTNENTRKQTLSNLDNLTSMLEAKGVATESDIQALKQTDAQIYQAGYTGEEIETATIRQKQIYNAGQQAAIEARSASNLEQRELMTQNAASIKNEDGRKLYTDAYQTGMNAQSFDRIANTIMAAGRNGMSLDSAMDKVGADLATVGGDEQALRSSLEGLYSHAQQQAKNDAVTEAAKALRMRSGVQRFGTGTVTDKRKDQSVALPEMRMIEAFAQMTGVDYYIADADYEIDGKRIFDGETQGYYSPSDSTIYLNVNERGQLAGTSIHEGFVEFASVWAGEETVAVTKALHTALIDSLGTSKYNNLLRAYRNAYAGETSKTDADLDKEILADMAPVLLSNKESLTKFVDTIDKNSTPKEARTIKEKLADWLSGLADALRDFLSEFKPTKYQQQVAEAQIQNIEELRDMLIEATARAVQNYQQARMAALAETLGINENPATVVENVTTAEDAYQIAYDNFANTVNDIASAGYDGKVDNDVAQTFIDVSRAFKQSVANDEAKARDVENIIDVCRNDLFTDEQQNKRVGIKIDGYTPVYDGIGTHSIPHSDTIELGEYRSHGERPIDAYVSIGKLTGAINTYEQKYGISDDTVRGYLDDAKKAVNGIQEAMDNGYAAEDGSRNGVISAEGEYFKTAMKDLKKYALEHVDGFKDNDINNKSTAASLRNINTWQGNRDELNAKELSDEDFRMLFGEEKNRYAVPYVRNSKVIAPNRAANVEAHDYTYDTLIAKDDIAVYSASHFGLKSLERSSDLEQDDVNDVCEANILKYNQEHGYINDRKLYNNDFGGYVSITKKSMGHGFNRGIYPDVITSLPAYFQNAIVINEADGKRNNADTAYVLVGAYIDESNPDMLRIVRMVVNNYEDGYQLDGESIETFSLYSAKQKEEATQHSVGKLPKKGSTTTSSTITIKQLLYACQEKYPNSLSLDVASHLNYDRSVYEDKKDKDIEGLRFSRVIKNSNDAPLTEGQQEYFKDSKAVDDDGRLKVMYHGSSYGGFNVFNSRFSDDGRSIFFTDDPEIAASYSGSHDVYAPTISNNDESDRFQSGPASVNYQAYLNLKNPLEVDAGGAHWNAIPRYDAQFAKDVAEFSNLMGATFGDNEDVDVLVNDLLDTEDDFDAIIKDRLRWMDDPAEYVKSRQESFDKLQKIADRLDKNISWIRSDYLYSDDIQHAFETGEIYVTTRELAREAKENGHDGVIIKNLVDAGPQNDWWEVPSTIMVAFDSNQVKSINNQNPTDDVDIRKSMKIDDNRNMNNEDISANRDEVAAALKKGKEVLKGTKVNKMAARNIAMEEKRSYGSAYDLEQFTNNLTKLFGYLHSGKSINYNDFVAVMQDVARPVVDAAYTSQASREDYAQFRNGINELSFSLTPEQTKAIKSAFGSMKAFERYYPEIHITEDGKSFAEQWSSLVDLSRGLLDENTDAVDMPTALVDAMEALRPSMNNWEDNTQAAHDMALDIISKYLANYHDDGANKAVINEFVKSAEKEIKASQKEWKSKIKEDYKERLKAERAYQKEIASNRVARANERSAEQIAKLRAKNATRIGDIRERQKRNHQLQQINKSAKKLYDALVNPTDANHVPKDVQEPVLELMASLDMSQPSIRQSEDGKWHVKILTERVQNESGRYSYVWQDIVADTREDALRQYNEALANGLGSQGARKWFERMQKISDLYTKQDKGKGLDDQLSQDMNEFLQGLSEELAEDFDRIIKKGRESGKASLADLNSDDLKVINKVLKNVQNAINKINKSLTNPSVEISQLANGTIHHSEVSKGRVNHKKMKFINSIGDFLMLDNATMETYLHSIGADGLTQTLLQGQDTKARLIREAQEYAVSVLSGIDQNTIKSWENDVIDYGGIKLTKAQVMSLYELMKREDATSHRAGGFKADADDVNTSYLTDEKLGEIIGTLTDEERRTADKLQQFLANNCAEWGNRTSNILVGYDKFGNPHYFPMKVDKASVNANVGELLGGLTNSIRNMGMTKAVQENATNALILDSIFDVYAQHVSDMATYSAWAAPVQDLIRFYNYKEVVEEDGFIKRTTTKDAIKKLMGKNGTTYFTKMVSSIQQREQSAFVGGNIVEFLTGSAKKAAVMGNIRVVVQQPTAIFRAGKMIDYKYLNAGMVGENENLRKEMIGTSDVYWLKNQGNIDGYITQSLKSQITGISSFSDKVSNWTGKLASKADQITWDAMYRAVIAEQIDKLGKDKIGTQEFQDAVNKRFENIMLRTQVYDGTITRSQFMRSPDWLNKMQSAFMAEPVKTYNIVLRDAIDLLQADSKDGKVKAMRELGRSAVVLLITNAVNAAVQSVWDAVRNAGDPDEDDNDFLTRMLAAFGIDLNVESTDEQIQAFLGGNFIDNVNMFNNIPIIADYADDAFTTIGELVSGKSSYSYSNSDLSMSGWEHLGDALKAIVMPGEKQTAYGTFTKVARAFSDLSGYPVYAIQRDLAGVYNVVAHDIAPMLGISMPVLQKQTKNTKKRQAKLDVYDTIWNSTDLDEVKAAVEDAVTQGNSYKTINDDMSENLKEDYINLYNENQSEATKMANRLAEIKAYLSDQEGTLDGKTHSEKVEYYRKNIKKWLE